MEQFNVWHLIARQWKIIIILTILVFAAALLTYHRGVKDDTVSLTVTALPERTYSDLPPGQIILSQQSADDVRYAVAATSSWLTDPAVVQQVNDLSGVTPADGSLRGLAKQFKVSIPSPDADTYQVQFSALNPGDATKLSDALKSVLASQSQAYNDSEKDDLKVSVTFGTPFVTQNTGDLPLTPIAGLVAGLVFGLVVAAAVDRKRA